MADITITAANVVRSSSANLLRGTAGVAIAAGDVVYLDPADNRYKLADCDAAAAEARSPSAFAVNSAAPGQPIAVQQGGDLTLGAATLVAGTTYYLSPNPGKIAPLADVLVGDYWTVVGIARSASVLRIGFLESGVVRA